MSEKRTTLKNHPTQVDRTREFGENELKHD